MNFKDEALWPFNGKFSHVSCSISGIVHEMQSTLRPWRLVSCVAKYFAPLAVPGMVHMVSRASRSSHMVSNSN